jgi:hypothetical protein
MGALNTDLPGILGVADPEVAGRLHSKRICRQVHDLLAVGGAVESMITTAVEQWHRGLVPAHASSAAKNQS